MLQPLEVRTSDDFDRVFSRIARERGDEPNARGQGVGEKLMRALIAEAARRGLGLCLSVRSENPARRLYERLGFHDIPGSAVTSRAGGMSIGMALGR
jgi:GNAT superfamily N-acetyltransferase